MCYLCVWWGGWDDFGCLFGFDLFLICFCLGLVGFCLVGWRVGLGFILLVWVGCGGDLVISLIFWYITLRCWFWV